MGCFLIFYSFKLCILIIFLLNHQSLTKCVAQIAYDQIQIRQKINKIMAEQANAQNNSHLQKLFNQRSPKTKYFSQSRIEQFNDSIAKQIINGDTVVNPKRVGSVGKPKNRYEEEKKRQKLIQASQEKQQLERKLSYLNRSIESIKKYSILKAQNQGQTVTKQRQKSPQQIKQLKKKDQQLTQAIKQRKQKIEKLRQEQLERKRLQQQKENEQKMHAEKQQKEKRKKQILQNLKKIQQKMEQRQMQHKKSTQKIKQLVHKKELFHKLQDQWKQKQALTLQERKRKLSQIRNYYKPLDISQINQHQKRLQQIRKQKQDIRLRQKKINSSNLHYQVPYISAFYKDILQKKSENNDPLNNSKLKIDKAKQFAQHIRENFAPQVDERRKEQLEKIIEQQADIKKQREQKLQQTLELRKIKGLQYTQYLRKLPKKRTPSTSTKVQQQGSKTARTVYKNYLSHSTSQQSPHKTDHAWNKILTKKELNKKEKARLLQYESERVEEQLRRKEQEGRLLKKNNEDDIDQEYYNMIKAKLSLLTSD